MSAIHAAAAKDLKGSFARSFDPVEVSLYIPPAEDSSLSVANHLARLLVQETPGINLRLLLVKQRKDDRVDSTPDLKLKSFLHAGLIDSVVIPFQEKRGLKALHNDVLLSPRLLAEKYKGRVFVEFVNDFNDPEFVQAKIIDNHKLKMSFSVRNLNRFGKPIIDAYEKHKGEATLINSHPAPLPGIRGLEGPFWTRFLGGQEYTTTLHVVDVNYDSGPILDYYSRAFDAKTKQPVMQFPRDAAPQVARMIFDQIHLRLVRRGHHAGLRMQDSDDAGYYTLPTQAEIDEAKSRGIVLVDAEEQIGWLARSFAKGRMYKELLQELKLSYADFVDRQGFVFSHSPFFFESPSALMKKPKSDQAELNFLNADLKVAPVVLIPRIGDDDIPHFDKLKAACEAAGYEVRTLDFAKLEQFAAISNLQVVKHAFERPGALALHPDIAELNELLQLSDRNVIVCAQHLAKKMHGNQEYQHLHVLLEQVKTFQAEKNKDLESTNQLVFVVLPEGPEFYWVDDTGVERIEPFVKLVTDTIDREKHALMVEHVETTAMDPPNLVRNLG